MYVSISSFLLTVPSLTHAQSFVTFVTLGVVLIFSKFVSSQEEQSNSADYNLDDWVEVCTTINVFIQFVIWTSIAQCITSICYRFDKSHSETHSEIAAAAAASAAFMFATMARNLGGRLRRWDKTCWALRGWVGRLRRRRGMVGEVSTLCARF